MIRHRVAIVALMCTGAAIAQSDNVLLSFEAASVKPAKPDSTGMYAPLRGGPGTSSPGQLSGTDTLKALLMRAYDLRDYQVLGPSWIGSERYEVAAKIPAGSSKEQVARMLRTLLAERFHLAARLSTKQLPGYALVVGKNGPKLKEVLGLDKDLTAAQAADDEVLTGKAIPRIIKGPDGMPDLARGSTVPRSYEVVVAGSDGILHKLWARRETMQQLADRLSGQLGRTVVDMTRLKDQYDFTLTWIIVSAGGGVPRTYPPPDMIENTSASVGGDSGPSLFTALQEQMGLKLESRKLAVLVLVIDNAQKKPVEN